jgi:hypothetical protein
LAEEKSKKIVSAPQDVLEEVLAKIHTLLGFDYKV